MTWVSLHTACELIVATGRWLDSRGWAPATSGNYSVRLDDGSVAITRSGRHKGRLVEADIMRVDIDGNPLEAGKPSAETSLHLALYRHFPHVGAVLHSHSSTAVALSRAFPDAARWTLAGHEMLKAYPGIDTHEVSLFLPIVDNSQNMAVIEEVLSMTLDAADAVPACLIRGHGLYAWGTDMAEAERVLEASEWLIAAELGEISFRNGSRS